MPPLPASRSVLAATMKMPAWAPEVMKTLVPLSTYPSSYRSAVARRLPASEPAPGSVSAKAPATYSPEAIRGMYFAFCSGVPNR